VSFWYLLGGPITIGKASAVAYSGKSVLVDTDIPTATSVYSGKSLEAKLGESDGYMNLKQAGGIEIEDSPAWDITGDLEFRCDVQHDWGAVDIAVLLNRWEQIIGDDRVFRFYYNGTGGDSFGFDIGNSSGDALRASFIWDFNIVGQRPVLSKTFKRLHLRVVVDVDNAGFTTADLYVRTDLSHALDSDSAWIFRGQRGSVGVQVWDTNAVPIQVMSQEVGGANMKGNFYRAMAWGSINKTSPLFDLDMGSESRATIGHTNHDEWDDAISANTWNMHNTHPTNWDWIAALYEPIHGASPVYSGGSVSSGLGPIIPTANVAYTGFAPVASNPVNISVARAAPVYSGKGISIIIGGVFTIGITESKVSYTAKSLTLREEVAIAKRAMTYSGKAVVLKNPLFPAVATVTYTGRSPTLVGNITIPVTAPAVAYSGQQPAVLGAADIVTVDSSTITYSGYVPTAAQSAIGDDVIIDLTGRFTSTVELEGGIAP
jgi:hypothetical protein